MSSSKQQEERERVRTLIEDSQSLPEALRHALLNRLNEEQAPSSTTSSLGVSRVLSSLKKAPAEVLDKVSQKVEEIREEPISETDREDSEDEWNQRVTEPHVLRQGVPR